MTSEGVIYITIPGWMGCGVHKGGNEANRGRTSHRQGGTGGSGGGGGVALDINERNDLDDVLNTLRYVS